MDQLSIRSKVTKSGAAKMQIIHDTLQNFGSVSMDGKTLQFYREGSNQYSDLYPVSDRCEVGITYHLDSNSWTYRGNFFRMPINMNVQPEIFFRMLTNMFIAYTEPRISFFQWAAKYHERYGADYSHMLYQLGLQLVGTGTMLLDLDAPLFARWDSMVTEFKVWFSAEPVSEIGVLQNMRFGFYEAQATHIFEIENAGFQHCLTNITEIKTELRNLTGACLEALAVSKSVSYDATRQTV